MKVKWTSMAMVLTTALFLSFPVLADHDVDLHINGDFKGPSSGYSPAPGWTLTADGGQARILPTKDRDDFMLEITASPMRSQSVVSDLHQVVGSLLKLEFKIRGNGNASVGYEAFDESRQNVVAADHMTVSLTRYDQKSKTHFVLPPTAKYIRIRLTAETGSTAIFRDVDAEMDTSRTVSGYPQPPAPGTIAAPPAPGAIAAPPAPGAKDVPPPPPPSHSPRRPMAKMLQDEHFYAYDRLAQNEIFEISLRVGEDIDFDLGEDFRARRIWRVATYDPRICRVKIEHDRDDDNWPRRDKAEIEIKAMRPGSTDVVFTSGEKNFTVRFTAM